MNPNPTLSSTLSPPSICSGTIFSYSPSSSTLGSTFVWNRNPVAGIGEAQANGTGNPNEILTNLTTFPIYVIYVYSVSANNCKFDQNVVVMVNPTPILSSSILPTSICSGTVYNYYPTSSTVGASFDWIRDTVPGISNTANSGSGNPEETLTDTTSGSINVTYIYSVSANGCVNPVTYNIVVTVYPVSIADAGNNTVISLGSSVTLNGTGGTTYTWSPATGLDNPNIANPVASPLSTMMYYLTVTDGNSCVSSDSLVISVLSDYNLLIANVMTPNSDGNNDTWIIVNIEFYPNTEVIIVNNQGQQVFKSSSYNNDWDGTFNGKPLPDGTYYYFLKFATGDKVYSGAVTIFNNK